jgi:hypothetical protein
MTRRILLGCGLVASVLYVSATIVGGLAWPGYSPVDQSVSELFAIDAPSRSIVVASFIAYDVLMVAFAGGLWKTASQKGHLRVVAGLIVLDQLRGAAGTIFAPMHLRGVPGTTTDVWHIILTIATVVLILLIIGLGATAFGRRFHLYSIATILVMMVFGVLAGLNGPQMAANLPTPWFGVEERINIFSAMLWYAVLAIGLLRSSETVARPWYPPSSASPSLPGSGHSRSGSATKVSTPAAPEPAE